MFLMLCTFMGHDSVYRYGYKLLHYSYEADFMQAVLKKNGRNLPPILNFTFHDIDITFKLIIQSFVTVDCIYTIELELNDIILLRGGRG